MGTIRDVKVTGNMLLSQLPTSQGGQSPSSCWRCPGGDETYWPSSLSVLMPCPALQLLYLHLLLAGPLLAVRLLCWNNEVVLVGCMAAWFGQLIGWVMLVEVDAFGCQVSWLAVAILLSFLSALMGQRNPLFLCWAGWEFCF